MINSRPIVIYSSHFGVSSKAEMMLPSVGVMVNHIPQILKFLFRRSLKANVKLEVETENLKWLFLLYFPAK